MRDRKLRAIAGLSFLTGCVFVVISVAFFYLEIPARISIFILIGFAVVQFRLAPRIYQKIYSSRWIDIPAWFRNRYHPQGFKSEFESSEVILLRTPSQVLSGPDCGESLGLGYLASVLREDGYKVSIIDSRLERLDVMQTVELLMAISLKRWELI